MWPVEDVLAQEQHNRQRQLFLEGCVFEWEAHLVVMCAQHLRGVQERSPYWNEQAVHMVRRRNYQLMNEGPVGLRPDGSGSSVEERVLDRTRSSYCSLGIFFFQPCAWLNDSKNYFCRSFGRRRI